MTNVVFNPNFDLGQDGIIGIKTGSDSNAAGLLPLRGPAEHRREERHGRRAPSSASQVGRSGPTPPQSMRATHW